MPTIFFKSVPYDKNLVTLALESGVDGIIVLMSMWPKYLGSPGARSFPTAKSLPLP